MNLNLKKILRGHHRLTQTPSRVQDIKKDRVSCKELESEPAIYLINDLLFGHKVLHNFTISPKLAWSDVSLPGNTRRGCLKQTCFGHLPCHSSTKCPVLEAGQTQSTGFRELTS